MNMKYLLFVLILTLIGCTSPYDECVNNKQEAWRKINPNADYGKSSAANERFMKECNSLKKS